MHPESPPLNLKNFGFWGPMRKHQAVVVLSFCSPDASFSTLPITIRQSYDVIPKHAEKWSQDRKIETTMGTWYQRRGLTQNPDWGLLQLRSKKFSTTDICHEERRHKNQYSSPINSLCQSHCEPGLRPEYTGTLGRATFLSLEIVPPSQFLSQLIVKIPSFL